MKTQLDLEYEVASSVVAAGQYEWGRCVGLPNEVRLRRLYAAMRYQEQLNAASRINHAKAGEAADVDAGLMAP